jgi:hypothetical protein
MSVFGGPEINQDNLFLCLDAGSSKSYPGSGTNVVDLSYNGNNGTLTGTVTSGIMDAPDFNSGDIKSFYFESGAFNAINLSSNSFGMGSQAPNCSLCAWVNINQSAITSATRIGFRDDFDFDFYTLITTTNNASGFECRLRTTGDVPTFTGNYANYINKWTSIVITAGSNLYNLYINGQLVNTAGFVGSFGATSNNFTVGSSPNGNSICYLSSVMFYKRVLSAAEVKRHYEAYKGRFRI